MALGAALISILLFHDIKGVREGTIIAALIVGIIARFLGRKLKSLEMILFPDDLHGFTPTL